MGGPKNGIILLFLVGLLATSCGTASSETSAAEPSDFSSDSVQDRTGSADLPDKPESQTGSNDDTQAWQVQDIDIRANRISVGEAGAILSSRRSILIKGKDDEWSDAEQIDGEQLDGFVEAFWDVVSSSRGFAVSEGTNIWESADGKNWSPKHSVSDKDNAFFDLFSDGSTLVAAGKVDDRATVWISERPKLWTSVPLAPQDSNAITYAEGFASGPAGMVAVGQSHEIDTDLEERSPAIWFSKTGEKWQQVDLAGDFVGRGGQLETVTWSDDLKKYVAAGWDGVSSQSQRAIIFTSTDGQNWVQVSNPSLDNIPFEGKLREIVATPSGLLAVGGDQYSKDSPGILWRSDDGQSWEAVRVYHNGGDSRMIAVAVEGETCSAVGSGMFSGPCSAIPAG